jgi:hypothetical protein
VLSDGLADRFSDCRVELPSAETPLTSDGNKSAIRALSFDKPC